AARHALHRHHVPVVLDRDAWSALAQRVGQALLPERDRFEHVVVGADQRALAHARVPSRSTTMPPSTTDPCTPVAVARNPVARGRRLVTVMRPFAAPSSHSAGSGTTAGAPGAGAIATAGPQSTKACASIPAAASRVIASGRAHTAPTPANAS